MLPGLTCRPLTTDDVPVWADLLDRAAAVDRPHVRDSPEWLRRSLTADGFDAGTQSLAGFDADGVLRAAAVVELRLGDLAHLRLPCGGVVDPGWRGRGVGRALLAWAERAARDRVARRRRELGRDVTADLQVWAADHRDDLARLCARAGLTPLRYFSTMRRTLPRDRELPAPEVPAGFRLVRFDEHGATGLRDLHNVVFADHWGSQPLTDADWERFVVGNPDYRPGWSWGLLAERADGAAAVDGAAELVAYANVYAHESDWPALGFAQADLGNLGVRRDHRGRGLAQTLLAAVARRAHEVGTAAVTLDVDSENPSGAVGLYERAGYVRVHGDVLFAKAL
ncbi:GNAT family N-acetyltransferase [Kineococcus sp. NPDC059986]|uniref:GNAT family N-acetyltransferase n=1 Tax=Kineococcus sp. NPDC059986 TaxID=3155538 RepID=UPI00344C4B16